MTRLAVAVLVVVAVTACSGGYPDDLDEQLASFSDAEQRRRAVLEANGIVAPSTPTSPESADSTEPADALDGAGGPAGPTDGLTERQRALRDGSIVATALPAVGAIGDDWWTTPFDPSSEIDGAVESFDTFRSCDVLVGITEQSDHRALAGAWYGDQRDLRNVQVWNRLFSTPTEAANWFAAESSEAAMACVRNLYLVGHEIDEAGIEGLSYDSITLTRAELGVAVDDDVEVVVFRADTPARIDGEIVLVDSVAEVRVLIDRMVVALRVLTGDAVETAVLVDTVVPTVVEAARAALAGTGTV